MNEPRLADASRKRASQWPADQLCAALAALTLLLAYALHGWPGRELGEILSVSGEVERSPLERFLVEVVGLVRQPCSWWLLGWDEIGTSLVLCWYDEKERVTTIAKRFRQTIQAPSQIYPGTTYLVRITLHSDKIYR